MSTRMLQSKGLPPGCNHVHVDVLILKYFRMDATSLAYVGDDSKRKEDA